MLLVETYLDKSPGKGIGIFAAKLIAKGTKYWIRDEAFDKIFTIEELAKIDKNASDYVLKYGFLEITGKWYLCGDNARFSNHSKCSNTTHHFNSEGVLMYTTASTDIKPNEEILCDYTEICLTCKDGVTFEEIL